MREVKKLLNYAIENNLKLEERGVTPIAVSLEAQAGIGKTSIVQQVAEERNMGFAKISLHELDETGDLVGFPIKEYECQILQRYQDEKGETKIRVMPNMVWVNEKQLGEAPGPNIPADAGLHGAYPDPEVCLMVSSEEDHHRLDRQS